MSRALALLCSLSPRALLGCGDTLLGGGWLDELMGLEEIPAEVAWELRWYQGPERPLLVECGLREPWNGGGELGEVYFGVTEIPPPSVEGAPEASALIEGDGYSYAIAMLVLMEPEVYDRADPEGTRTDLDTSRGTWGVVRDYVVLVAEGDTIALTQELMLDPHFPLIEPGVQLVGFLPEMMLGMGTFTGAIYPTGHEEREYLWEQGLPAVHIETIDEMTWEVFEGLPMGGAERQGCAGEGS
jgi:hypothetical protein